MTNLTYHGAEKIEGSEWRICFQCGKARKDSPQLCCECYFDFYEPRDKENICTLNNIRVVECP